MRGSQLFRSVRQQFHEGQTCKEFDEHNEQYVALSVRPFAPQHTLILAHPSPYHRMAMEGATKCPNPKCPRYFIMGDGCDIIRCCQREYHGCKKYAEEHGSCNHPNGCGFQFCRLCMVDMELVFKEGNHKHKDTCRHYFPWDPPAAQ